jgi:hypothetical protein
MVVQIAGGIASSTPQWPDSRLFPALPSGKEARMAQGSNGSNSSDFWGSVVDACPNFLGVTVASIGQTLTDVTNGVIDTLNGHGSDVADMLDRKAAETARFFDSLGNDIVDAFPNAAGALAATAVSSVPRVFLQFGQGMADTTRLGQGVAEGTASGVAKDGLRALQIVAPALSSLQELKLARLAKAYVDPAPELRACVPVTITKALKQVGQSRAFGYLDEMVTGLSKNTIGRKSLHAGRHLREMVGDLRRLGAKFENVQTGGTLESLENLARSKPNGVTVFHAQWRVVGELEDTAHAMYAYIDRIGKFRIADRSGNVVSSLKELEALVPSYSGISGATLQTTAMYIPKATYLVAAANAGGVGLLLNIVKTSANAYRRQTAQQGAARTGRGR